MEAPWKIWQSLPILVQPVITTLGPTIVPSSISTFSPITVKGPISTFLPIFAFGWTTAKLCIFAVTSKLSAIYYNSFSTPEKPIVSTPTIMYTITAQTIYVVCYISLYSTVFREILRISSIFFINQPTMNNIYSGLCRAKVKSACAASTSST